MQESNRDQVEELFHTARALPESERAAFVDRVCRDDSALRREVKDLLAHDRESFLAHPPRPVGELAAEITRTWKAQER